MTQTKSWVKIVRTILYNAKWIILCLLLLNLFGFGYWEQMREHGLGGEETLWGVVMVIALILFFVFDKVWKNVCNKICDAL